MNPEPIAAIIERVMKELGEHPEDMFGSDWKNVVEDLNGK